MDYRLYQDKLVFHRERYTVEHHKMIDNPNSLIQLHHFPQEQNNDGGDRYDIYIQSQCLELIMTQGERKYNPKISITTEQIDS